MYRTGTVSVVRDSHEVVGKDTFFQAVGSINVGYLFTIDGEKFYEITAVHSETRISIEHIVTGLGYQETTRSNIQYGIVLPFGASVNAQIAKNVIDLQAKWQRREKDISGWMSTDATSHEIESYTGEKVSIVSLQELTRLINAGQYPSASAWLDGAGPPDSSIGGEGVFYLDSEAGDIYRKSNNAWSIVMTIAGGDNAGGISADEVFQLTHAQLQGSLLDNLLSILNSLSLLGEADFNQNQALMQAVQSLEQNYQNADENITQAYKNADADVMEKASESNPAPKLDLLNHGFETLRYAKVNVANEAPTGSPNNKNEWVLDEVRKTLHVAMIDKYLPMPDVIESRYFAIFTRGWFIRLNSSYTGDIKLRVYPVQNGGNGLPNNPVLANNQWHDITVSVTSLTKIGQWIDGGDDYYFTGIIDTVRLVGLGKHATLDRDESHSYSLGGYIDYQFSTASYSIFRKFNKKTDGLWYSEDLTPKTPSEIGGSWVQSPTDYRTYTVTEASGSSDALQPFNDDTYEHYTTVVILKTSNLVNDLAVTENNTVALRVVEDGTEKFTLENVRMYLKRTNSNTPVSGMVTIDSIHAVLTDD